MSTRELGQITRRWEETTENGVFQHRERVGAIAGCPKCDEDVELLQESDMWRETSEGSRIYEHTGYGPSMGQCCGLLIADWWEGCFVYDLPEKPAAAGVGNGS